jgi:hypothetical protein
MATLMPRGYRSATEYHFDEEQTDAIVRTVTYHPIGYDLTVISFPPREHVDIRPSIATPFPRTPNVGLGSLDQLPLELLHETLLHLDMHSLFKFRQTNLGSRQVVDCLKQYQLVVSHGLNLFCALLRTRVAMGTSLLDMYVALCTKSCSLCDNFGGFVFLPTWKRCCMKCLQQAPETQVHSLAAVRKQLHLTKAEVNQLVPFKTLPGKYTKDESVYKSRVTIVSVHQASLISRRQPQPLAQAQPANLARNEKYRFMASCALPYYDKSTGKVEHGMSCAGCQLALEKDIIGSRGEKWVWEARDKAYPQDGFLEHFRWCEQAQLLWTSSDQGKFKPPELPELARRSSFFNRRK